jgi:hypothetical protein
MADIVRLVLFWPSFKARESKGERKFVEMDLLINTFSTRMLKQYRSLTLSIGYFDKMWAKHCFEIIIHFAWAGPSLNSACKQVAPCRASLVVT